ncbi:methylamine dehydrogenase light chain [Yunchengibacter salinarum]|uniref:methylamine dehydrogenase light chain n=1 Tax=Yunchengibacter salinarum TaxID=3133399 RepID=UPI0035B68C35
MAWFDTWMEKAARGTARGLSRRHFLSRLGSALVGVGLLPLLPISRLAPAGAADPGGGAEGDPQSCDYWRYCGVDGFLCSCCGGSQNTCPPGTEPSPITWLGTCHNPADGRDYVISYNDCCGKSACGRCECYRSEGDRPIYRPSLSNDINWCLGTESVVYNCSTAVVVGVADDNG